MGRPSKLTDDLIEELCGYLEEGMPTSTACDLAGISARSFQRWRKRGKEEINRVEEGHVNCRERKSEKPYCRFWRRTTRARAEGDRKHVKNIVNAGEEDWRASAWYLERARPEQWSKTTKHEHMGEGGGPVDHNMSIEEWREKQNDRIDKANELLEQFQADSLDELEDIQEQQGGDA